MGIHLISLFLLFAASALPDRELRIDAEASTLTWTATKVTGSHTGNVRISGGAITLNGDLLGAADISVDMTSITCTDITNEGSNAKLVGHLKSADFFDVVNHPKATFRTKRVEREPGKGEVYSVTGDLVIKGISRPALFSCSMERLEGRVRVVGTLEFDRAQYDIRYRSGSFFDDLGDKLIHDTVELAFELTAR